MRVFRPLALPLEYRTTLAHNQTTSREFMVCLNFIWQKLIRFDRNVGAVAELIDVSCLAGSSVFRQLPDQLYDSWVNFNQSSVQEIIDHLHVLNPPEILAQHYFVSNPTTGQGLSPKWDFTSSGKFSGNKDAFFVGRGQGSLPAPTDPKKDINWLEVANVQGSIANTVFRTDTRGGQPPSSVSDF